MRETVESLKAYFIVAGLIGIVHSVPFKPALLPAAIKVRLGVDFVCTLAFLVCGIALRKLLRDSPGLVKGLIYVAAVMQVVVAPFELVVFRDAWELVVPAVVLLLSWYLLINVNRLSAAEMPPEQQA
jgi:hypothetical protein